MAVVASVEAKEEKEMVRPRRAKAKEKERRAQKARMDLKAKDLASTVTRSATTVADGATSRGIAGVAKVVVSTTRLSRSRVLRSLSKNPRPGKLEDLS